MALLSIVIPTCNRPQYLEKVVELINTYTNDTEVIISDNSDNNELHKKLSKYIESGLVTYTYVSKKISVVENFERAIKKVTGKYVTYLGDDDGIGPDIENIVRWMDKNNIDASFSYSHRFLANYYWPGVKSKYFDDKYSSRLFVGKFTGEIKIVDLATSRKEVKNAPGTGLNNLPRIYHGIVSFSLIEEIQKNYGSLFGGVSPDIYSAYQIASIAKNVVKIDYPFIIPGGSKESTAGQRVAKSDNGVLSETDHTARFGNSLVWDKRIPEYYSPYNVWAYSLLKAVERTDNNLSDYNFYRLYIISYIRYKQFKNATSLAVRHTYTNPKILGWCKAIFSEACFLIHRVTNKLLGNKQSAFFAKDILEAYEILNEHIKKENIMVNYKKY